MISFLLTFSRFFHGVHRAWLEPNFRSTLLINFFILLSGTLFYTNIEGWRILDALYFSVMTLTTIGYGDLHPTNDFSKIFTMVYSVIGIGVFVSLIAQLARAQIRKK